MGGEGGSEGEGGVPSGSSSSISCMIILVSLLINAVSPVLQKCVTRACCC